MNRTYSSFHIDKQELQKSFEMAKHSLAEVNGEINSASNALKQLDYEEHGLKAIIKIAENRNKMRTTRKRSIFEKTDYIETDTFTKEKYEETLSRLDALKERRTTVLADLARINEIKILIEEDINLIEYLLDWNSWPFDLTLHLPEF